MTRNKHSVHAVITESTYMKKIHKSDNNVKIKLLFPFFKEISLDAFVI